MTINDVAAEIDRRISSIPEVMQGLGGLSRAAVYVLIDEGKLTRIKIGQRSFILTSSMEKLLDEAIAAASAGGGVEGPHPLDGKEPSQEGFCPPTL